MEIKRLPSEWRAKGAVWGACWGGGECGYASEEVVANSYDELVKKIRDGIENGSLDSGMGFESLLGAAMLITETKQIKIDDEVYCCENAQIETFGEVPDELIDFALWRC